MQSQEPPRASFPPTPAARSATCPSEQAKERQVLWPPPSETRRSVVVVLDVGSCFTKTTVAYRGDQACPWICRGESSPSSVLLDPDRALHSFGDAARDAFASLNLPEADRWFFFDSLACFADEREDPSWVVSTNGNRLPAKQLLRSLLAYLRNDRANAMWREFRTADVTREVKWVVVISDAWASPVWEMLEEAMAEAGLGCPRREDSRAISLLESEASASFLRVRNALLRENPGSFRKRGRLPRLLAVVHCGGASLDGRVYETSERALKTVRRISDSTLGGRAVAGAFEEWMRRAFGDPALRQFKEQHLPLFLDLVRRFEFHGMRSPYDDLRLRLPLSLIYCVERNHRRKVHEVAGDGSFLYDGREGVLELRAQAVSALFRGLAGRVVARTEELLASQMDPLCQPPPGRDATVLFTGGFSVCPLVREEVRRNLRGFAIRFGRDPGAIALHGALAVATDPAARPALQRATATSYGVGIFRRFDPRRHDLRHLVVRGTQMWCADVFERFFSDTDLPLKRVISRDFLLGTNGTSARIDLYRTDRDDVQVRMAPQGARIKCSVLNTETGRHHVVFLDP